MKKLMTAAALLISVIAASQAEAHFLNGALSASLTKFDIQSASSLSNKRITNGNINVSLASNEIKLTLNPSFYCPPGAMCMQVMPAAIEFKAQGIETTTGNCNETIYTATEDQRDVDGNMVKLTVVNNSTNTCKYFVAIPATQITLQVMTSRGRDEHHTFEAGSLK